MMKQLKKIKMVQMQQVRRWKELCHGDFQFFFGQNWLKLELITFVIHVFKGDRLQIIVASEHILIL